MLIILSPRLFDLTFFLNLCSAVQPGKKFNGNYTAQRVSIQSLDLQPRIKEVQIKLPGSEKLSHEEKSSKTPPPLRYAVKEVLVCVSRGPSPEKQLIQKVYHHMSSSDEDESVSDSWIRSGVSRSRYPFE